MGNLIQVIQFFGGIPTFFILFLIFIFVFRHHLSKNDHIEEKNREAFWKKEQDSLVVRKKEIPNDLFISFNKEVIPTFTKEDYNLMNSPSLYSLQQALVILSDSKMLNLPHLMNSEIRMQFGTANLPTIEAYEENYFNCIKNINTLANSLYDKGYTKEALALLIEGAKMDSDITSNYQLLGKIYTQSNDQAALNDLITQLSKKDSRRFSKIIEILKDYNLKTDDHVSE